MDIYYQKKVCIAIEKIEKHLSAIEDALRKHENRANHILKDEPQNDEQKEEE